jgi:prophage DNA circulation protein
MTNFTDALISNINALTNTLTSSINDPLTQILTLAGLAQYYPTITGVSSTLVNVEAASAAATRRAALGALSTACANFVPTSVNQSQAIITLVRNAYNAEILFAADGTAGYGIEDTITQDLTSARDAAIKDLKARGTNLPNLTLYNTNASLPVSLISYLLYADASRGDEIVGFNDTVPHPWFMPPSYYALSR